MVFDPDKHHRRSIRLPEWDYASAGVYFVTICTVGRKCLFGDIANAKLCINEYGEVVAEEWVRSAQMRSALALDEWVVMPNHFHGIIIIRPVENISIQGDPQLVPAKPGPPSRSIGAILAGFKATTTRRINQLRGTHGFSVWQRNYYEHIIRNDGELNRVRKYIVENPARWAEDNENPARVHL